MKATRPIHQLPELDSIKPSLRAQFTTRRDASFSSYLQPHDDNRVVISADDSELGIFDAEKYYRGVHDHPDHKASLPSPKLGKPKPSDASSTARLSSVSSVQSLYATPAGSSEASWNSQSGLLANPPGSVPVKSKNFSSPNGAERTAKVGLRINPTGWFSWRRCPCSGKKSVQVEESQSAKTTGSVDLRRSTSSMYSSRQSSPKPPPASCTATNGRNIAVARHLDQTQKPATTRVLATSPISGGFLPAKCFPANQAGKSFADVNGFTFPLLNDPPASVKRIFKPLPPPSPPATEDAPRESLEVFQPPEYPISRNPRPKELPKFPMSPKSRRASYDDENVSDASSDLFEIDSLETQFTSRNHNQVSIDQNSDLNIKRLALVDPTECYPPSEVSIDWSVTTAEGFDRASLTNFSLSASEVGYVAAHGGGSDGSAVVMGGGGKRRGNVGLSLSCSREKAVSVGPGPVKCSHEVGRDGPVGLVTGPIRHVSGRAQAHVSNSSGRFRPTLLSVPFAT